MTATVSLPSAAVEVKWENTDRVDALKAAVAALYLIDASGNIVAKNLRGEDLYKKVEELLGK